MNSRSVFIILLNYCNFNKYFIYVQKTSYKIKWIQCFKISDMLETFKYYHKTTNKNKAKQNDEIDIHIKNKLINKNF